MRQHFQKLVIIEGDNSEKEECHTLKFQTCSTGDNAAVNVLIYREGIGISFVPVKYKLAA